MIVSPTYREKKIPAYPTPSNPEYGLHGLAPMVGRATLLRVKLPS